MTGDGSSSDSLHNPFTGQTIRFISESEDALIMESSYQAGGFPAPAHLHPEQQERFRVLAGAVRASIAGEERTLETGDRLLIDAGTPHEMGGHPEKEGTVRWEVRPALRTREFFERLFASLNAAAAQQEGADVPSVPFDVNDYDDVFRLAEQPDPDTRTHAPP